MELQQEVTDYCPYCGEKITLLVDASNTEQNYIEDCEVCCRPINIHIEVSSDGNINLSLAHENEC
ncbi:CPXCG motif-containing cysteine-rich protein [Teredinibacter sp. KSP-S5-2]|uniref:CPXCG motif-containing cysteine-rich protein n=1 Tax=Teredinibacter sp. KSP-S5-2 TaxID=3034506 RepID=UPI0029349355|nr:CPXCG motif-containing cysteine-rich protein [Teredinibacter sp. KSP-S5-2]WNO10027.1 CPXCG motif-containing cysteine-rich protein [Teredinibacter sp. KSP-S5-2]